MLVERLHDVARRLGKVRELSPDRFVAFCPNHNDKEKMSLSVRLSPTGKILFHCFIGCKYEAIAESMQLKIEDLFPAQSHKKRKPNMSNDCIRYDYHYPTGDYAYSVIRQWPKKFWSCHFDKANNMIKSDKVKPPMLWGWPSLCRHRDRIVFWCEGEKDAMALSGLDFLGTTLPFGAKKRASEIPDDAIHELSMHPHVIVAYDYDPPGILYAIVRLYALSINEIKCTPLHLPYATLKSDVYDFLRGFGNKRDEIRMLSEDCMHLHQGSGFAEKAEWVLADFVMQVMPRFNLPAAVIDAINDMRWQIKGNSNHEQTLESFVETVTGMVKSLNGDK